MSYRRDKSTDAKGKKKYHGKNAPTTAAKGMSNQKYDTDGFHKQHRKSAVHQTTTCAETLPAQCISLESAKAECSQEGIWPESRSKSKRNRSGQIANRISGRYVFHQNAEGTSNLSWIEDTCQQACSRWKKCTASTLDNRQKTFRPARTEASDRKEETQKTSMSRVGKAHPSGLEKINRLDGNRRRGKAYYCQNQHTRTTDTSPSGFRSRRELHSLEDSKTTENPREKENNTIPAMWHRRKRNFLQPRKSDT